MFIHPSLDMLIIFRTREVSPELPELKARAIIDRQAGKYFPNCQSDIRVYAREVELEQVITAFSNAGLHINQFSISPLYLENFWENIPDDCIGACLNADGYVSLAEPALAWRILPLDEPVYTSGRPVSGEEHSRQRPHVLSRGGGVPIVSDELIAQLRAFGAEGDTAPIIYRGANKQAYDRVQPGYKRFLVRPEYPIPPKNGFEFLPAEIPENFGICALRRSTSDECWYELALSLPECQELKETRPSILLTPLFRLGGQTHNMVNEIQAAVERINHSQTG
ncbi:hypothetical protein ETAA8_44760 [Anatilimnocola aggregata]|uniref:Uncharacterized protein n=1 Tax=Anatilimnocola aggregata TaxID=2528021 RepID=A0A517YGM0_9BACT|nr:hypothetical protein [Anatilimnocola aggregata]QDU29367.1 hypothetical protein ETAA8_44760 [Anatilimnocola aggregata]